MQEEVNTLSDQILLKENQLSTKQMWKETEIGLQKIINDKIPSKTAKGYKNKGRYLFLLITQRNGFVVGLE